MLLINGPFSLKLGDTAEVVIALVAGLGTDNLKSVTELKKNSRAADTAYLNLVDSLAKPSITGVLPNKQTSYGIYKYALNQNYPNPFNPSTVISYSISRESYVTIKVYNVLGKEIETLVNENKPAGIYKVKFNGSSLPSGVYFYRIQAGSFESSRKLILLK